MKFLELPFTQMEAALTTGRVDAALMAEPDVTAVLWHGKTRPFAKTFDAIGAVRRDSLFRLRYLLIASFIQEERAIDCC